MPYSFLKKFSRQSLAMAFFLIAGSAGAQTATPTKTGNAAYPAVPEMQIQRAEFGVFRDLNSPATTLDPTRVVARDGRPIGWVIAVDTQKPTVRWREEFTVPAPPQHWGLTPDKGDIRPPTVSADKLTATTERQVMVGGGTISHWWKLDATDARGPHTMRVYVEDVLVSSFSFDVN